MADSTTTLHARRSRLVVMGLLPAVALLMVLLWGTAPATAAGLAPPAPPATQSACAAQRASSAKTADIVQRISGRIGLGGCVTDGGSGIAHILLEWHAGSDAENMRAAHGRICTDASISTEGAWSCAWNTDRLPRGEYVVRFVAIDEVGNAGHFDRHYELVDAPVRGGGAAAPPPGDTTPSRPDTTPPTGDIEPSTSTPNPSTPNTTMPPVVSSGDDVVPAPSDDSTSTDSTQTAADPSAAAADSSPVASGAALAQPGVDAAAAVAPDSPAPESPALDAPDLLQQLAIARIASCDRGEVADAPTDDPSIVSQVDQADAVRVCIAPALLSLGAVDVALDALPVPPAVRITFEHRADLEPLLEQLPETVAGVPMEYVAADDPPQSHPAGDTALPAAGTAIS